MKRTATVNLLFLVIIMFSSCSKKLSYTDALIENEKDFNSTQMVADANFLVEVRSYSELEIELCKLAEGRSYAVVTKEMATQHIQDHRKMREDLKDVADDLDVNLPVTMSSEHKALLLKVKSSNRRNFDQEFVDALKNINDNMEREFAAMATKAYEAKTRAFAARKLEIIQRHGITIEEVDNSLLRLE